MNELLRKAIALEPITEQDIADELTDLCGQEHSSCSDACPVYAKNGGCLAPYGTDGCACFKNGRAMRDFLRA